MKNNMLALMAALALAFCGSEIAVGQISYQPGIFGYRALGQPLAPVPGTFGGVVQVNVAGSARLPGWPAVGNGLTAPWGLPYQSGIAQTINTLPATQWALPAQQSVGGIPVVPPPETLAEAMQIGPAPEVPPRGYNGPIQVGSPPRLPLPGYNAPASLPEQGVATMSGAATGATRNYTIGRTVNRAVTARAEPFVHSPELSARLTRIARTRGMLSGPAIDVYLSGNIAVVQGAVRNAANRTVLGNVLGLEPDVSQIDNRLVVQGYASRRPNASAGNVRRSVQGYHANTTPAYGP
jgi:hypothetical protein